VNEEILEAEGATVYRTALLNRPAVVNAIADFEESVKGVFLK
jgi:hypothetical protein